MELNLLKNIPLSEYTTIGLGGNAEYFFLCESEESLLNVLKYGKENNLKIQIISGGSNIIFPDKGYNGIVIKINIKGIKKEIIEDDVILKTGAGENWDEFVLYSINNELSGAECLSGIPGSAGATPVQNVGAYGQEVKDLIESVRVIDRLTFEFKNISGEECGFDYRNSRFKDINRDKDRYIITEVTFRFNKYTEPEIKYPELKKLIESGGDYFNLKTKKDKLIKIRDSVLELRRKKSMIADLSDPNSKSCGSFFTNPVLSEDGFKIFQSQTKRMKLTAPYYTSSLNYKIPAAWLVEQSGFKKGYSADGAGISEHHSLAIINRGGKTSDVLHLAGEIQKAVFDKFGIQLETEPEIIK